MEVQFGKTLSIGRTRDEHIRQIREKIQRGWHETFVWIPKKTLDGTIGWGPLEVKYYGRVLGRRIVKKDLNLDCLDRVYSLRTMYREIGSDKEKRVYLTEGGIAYVDSNEIGKHLLKKNRL